MLRVPQRGVLQVRRLFLLKQILFLIGVGKSRASNHVITHFFLISYNINGNMEKCLGTNRILCLNKIVLQFKALMTKGLSPNELCFYQPKEFNKCMTKEHEYINAEERPKMCLPCKRSCRVLFGR